MTREETVKILGVIRAVYPAFHAGSGQTDLDAAVAVWQSLFDAEPFAQVQAAVKAFIATDTKGFPPAIGQIKEQLARLRQGEGGELTEQEAWALVQKALKNGIYGYAKEFAALPATVRGCIGSAMMLHEWAQMDIETTNSVVASNFMRSYRARAGHVREMEKLPPDVRALYAAVGGAFRLPEAAPPKPETPALEAPTARPAAVPWEEDDSLIPAPEHFLAIGRKLKADAQARQAADAKAIAARILGGIVAAQRKEGD